MKKKILMILFAMTLMTACEKNNEKTVTMESIHKEEGIPVKVKVMEKEEFVKSLNFSARLSGNRQSAASAMIGGRIEKINVEVGDLVKKDSILMEFPKDAPAAQFKQAKSAFELAKKTYERMKNLYEIGGISKQELDQTKTQYDVSSANWDAAQQMLKVRAPISGYVSNISVRETDGVHAETVLAIISQTEKMKARVWVTEDEICEIQKGMTAKAIWKDAILPGKVVEVAMSMDRTHNAFPVDLIFSNPKNLCKSGVIADIQIRTYENPEAFVLSRKTVLEDDKGKFVYKINSLQTKKTYVQTGEQNGNIEIIDGLQIGDKVIVEGLNLINEKEKVKIIK